MSRNLNYKNLAKQVKLNLQGLDQDLSTAESNISSINSNISTNYIPKSDIVNDLTTGGTGKVLSAEQGKSLKTLIDSINTLLSSNDVNLDTVQELVDAIKIGFPFKALFRFIPFM